MNKTRIEEGKKKRVSASVAHKKAALTTER
jgi:hypothetical protein